MNYLSKVSLTTISALSIIAISMVVYAALNTWPNVEDLEHALVSRDIDTWQFILNRSISHDGRYSTNILHSISPLAFNKIHLYRYNIVLTIVLLILSMYIFSHVVIKESSIWVKILFTLVLSSMIIYTSPSLYDLFFWKTSSYLYGYSCIFLLITISSIKRYFYNKHNVWYFLLCVFLMWISIGFCESFLPLYILTASISAYYCFMHDKKSLKIIFPLCIVAIIFTLFFLVTPSVPSRMDESLSIDWAYNRIYYIYNSLFFYFKELLNLIFSPVMLFFLLVSFFFKEKISLNKLKPHFLLLFFLIAPYIVTLPFFMALGNVKETPERIFIPVVFLQLIILFVLIFPRFWNYLINSKPALFSKRSTSIGLNLSILLLSVLLVVNTMEGKGKLGLLYKDISLGKIKEYDLFMGKRYNKLIKASQSNEEYRLVCIEELKEYPASLFKFHDFQNNRKNSKWNRYMEAYFKIDEIRVFQNNVDKFEKR